MYFFEDTYWASWWCNHVKRFDDNEASCVECDINVTDEFLWDIRSEEGKELLELAYDLALAYSQAIGHPIEKKDLSDGEAVNHLSKKTPIKVVIGEFPEHYMNHEGYPSSRLLRKTQVQISVRDERCLSGFQMCSIL